jgi:hypothetical protein
MKRIFVVAFALAATGCTSDQVMREDGMTTGAGEAIAANTALQMVDPWQPGVQDTDLVVPARGAQEAASPPPPKPTVEGTTKTN